MWDPVVTANCPNSALLVYSITEISQWNSRLVMQVHQSYLSLCWFFLLPARLDDIYRTLQWNNKLVIGFLSFISFGYSMVTGGLKCHLKASAE